jgi:hypothetical protein
MNKWQIIAPVTAMFLAVLAVGIIWEHNHDKEAYFAGAFQVARDLVTTTNSDRVTTIPPALKTALVSFLGSPATVGSVEYQTTDAAEPGFPRATVTCLNDAGEKLRVTLHWEAKLKKYTLVSFAYPADQVNR